MFDRCRSANEGSFGAFLMLGDPDLKRSAQALDAMIMGGADMLEVGIPFSDPVADGPVIQAASERALAAGVRTADCLALIAAARTRHPHIPLGVLTYANIAIARGLDRFVCDLADAGGDSLLIADVPTLEAPRFAAATRAVGLDLVMIAAPNTPADKLDRIAELSSGYTYCVARAGVTGADRTLTLDHGALFEALGAAGAPPPVLGFGIATPDHVRQALSSGAAGVISGSAIVQRLADGATPAELAAFVRSMKDATRLA
jgi:tryptophan synthase alpha chain